MTAISDIVVIGGGAIGLALALELRLQGASVTLLSRDLAQAASHAAAGMLAPQAEQLSPGAMLELCLRSRSLYPDWTQKLEALTGLPTGYWACGILAPVYEEAEGRREERRKGRGERRKAGEVGGAREDRETRGHGDTEIRTTQNSKLPPPTPYSLLPTPAHWLDRASIHHQHPGLSKEVIGGWWYPKDAQVDNRSLTKALWVAVREAGVDVQKGVIVQAMLYQGRQISGLQTSNGTFQSGHYVLATGAWSQDVLPLPVTPRKGQMLSVQVPAGQTLPLQTVLFGSEIYIVPRQDGRIIIGATSEDVGFTPDNTPEGVQALWARSLRLYPALQQFPMQECWWGFRPATPDELPLLGASPYDNLTLATGHYRNGILLAPVTAQLMTDRILHQRSDPLVEAFHWSRFRTD
ncbi:MAG: FAD-dependent oxidoreductase [Lyngbya sp. HA4199-MV5]|jgi:thiazole synthase|nr:FAD-dependent oxidoreductase [Lyngbya sp. HA4199-MV5]